MYAFSLICFIVKTQNRHRIRHFHSNLKHYINYQNKDSSLVAQPGICHGGPDKINHPHRN